MEKHNKTTFLSSLGSSNGLASLKKKLKGNDENCPVRALSQLIDPSIPVPKVNTSLRSLRCKPSSSQPKRPEVNDTLSMNKVVVSAQIGTPPSSVIEKKRTENANTNWKSNSRNLESIERLQERNTESVVRDGDHAFAVPSMRAPKVGKRLNDYLAELDNAATACENLLEEAIFQQWCMVMTAYCLHKAEADETHERSDQEKEMGEILEAFIKNVADGKGYELKVSCGVNDMDNFSSVSGHPPMSAGFINNQCTSDQVSVLNGNYGYGMRGLNSSRLPSSSGSVLGFNSSRMPGSSGSVLGFNVKSNSSVLGFGGGNLNSTIMSNRLVPKFMKPAFNPYHNSSMMGVGVIPDLYQDVFQNQLHQKMMGHGANSVIGYPNQSMMKQSVMGHPNMSIMSHYPQSVIGYPNQTIMGGMPNRNMYQNMSVMQPSVQLERITTRDMLNNQDDNESEYQCGSEQMGPPRMPPPKYFNSTVSEQNRNPLRTINENIAQRAVPRIVVNDDSSNYKRNRETAFSKPVSRAKPADTPIRALRNKLPPNTPATGNLMNTSKVTRSGRTVKTPQHYWAGN